MAVAPGNLSDFGKTAHFVTTWGVSPPSSGGQMDTWWGETTGL